MPPPPGIQSRADALARILAAHPVIIVAAAVILALAGAMLAADRLHLDADTNHLISEDRPFMEPFLGWIDEFGDLEYLYVVVDPQGRETDADAAIRELVPALRAVPGVPRVDGWISAEEQWRLAPWAMPQSELSLLAAGGEGLSIIASDATPAQVLAAGRARVERLASLGALNLSEEERRRTGGSATLLLEAIAAAVVPGVKGVADAGPVGPGSERAEEFLINPGGSLRFIQIMPRKDFGRLDAIAEPLAGIRSVLTEVGARHPSIGIGLTGKPVLQADELATSDADMTRCAAGAFVLIAIVFTWIFRGVRRPLLIVIAFMCAFGWTYGAATLLVGRLNLLSIVFMLVLVGVGLDYGVHVVSRWTTARRGGDARTAVREVLATAGVGNLFGAATSAGVFLLGLATDFGGLRELGLIAGVGLLLCMIAMVIVLPALLVLFDRPVAVDPSEDGSTSATAPPSATTARTRFAVIGLAGFASVVLAGVALQFARFENNLLELQAVGLESVEWEHRILADSSSASWFAAAIADSIEDVESIIARAGTHPEIGAVRSVLDLVPPPDPTRELDLATLVATIGATPPIEPTPPPLDADGLRRAARGTDRLAAAAEAVDREAADRLRRTAARLAALADGLASDPTTSSRVRDAIDEARSRARMAVQAMRAGAADGLRSALPEAVRDRLMASSGRFMVSLVPAEDVWSPEPMARFVTAIRAVDPNVTGVPITQYESLADMQRAFLTMGVLSTVLVLVLVSIDFRRWRPVLIAMTVLAVGLLWTIGLAAAVGVHLNVANFFAIPILIGIGIDSAIHMLHRADECEGGPLDFRGTRHAVVLTALTTGIGFGSLVFARHRGLESLGLVMAIGSVCCLLATVVLLPTLVAWMRKPRSTEGGHL